MENIWRSYTFIGFDTETTGRYPLGSEVCELAAVKWRDGKIIDEFQTLLKPSRPMSQDVINIHGITNDMVEEAPRIREKIGEFHEFIRGGILVAHHAPFDLGFLAIEFERASLPLPTDPVICTSLLSRKVFPESDNHRLQTLVGFLGIEQGTAHRALDDSKACLGVGLKCMERLGDRSLKDVFVAQGGPLYWARFSMRAVEETETGRPLIRAIRENQVVEMVYSGGSEAGSARRVHPQGLVRNPEGDFLVAYCEKDQRPKRYFLDKIVSVKPL